MKLRFSLKDKEASFDADVEKKMDNNSKSSKPDKKSSYQIKQEEKRNNMDLKYKQEKEKSEIEHKRKMQEVFLALVHLPLSLFFV